MSALGTVASFPSKFNCYFNLINVVCFTPKKQSCSCREDVKRRLSSDVNTYAGNKPRVRNGSTVVHKDREKSSSLLVVCY